MKTMVFKTVIVMFFILNTVSCGTNIFTPLNPTDVNSINDINTLLALGDTRIRNLDYPGAYEAYEKVLILDPDNSKALDGISTAYRNMKIPTVDFINAISSGNFSSINLNNLYDVGSFLSPKLYQIINGSADGNVASDNVNINFNFFIFNSFYAIFYISDSDGDKIVENDTNDNIIILKNAGGITISNKMAETTDIIKLLGMAHNLRQKQDTYTNAKARSSASLNTAAAQMTTTEAQEMLRNSLGSITNLFAMIDGAYAFLDTNILTNALIPNYTAYAAGIVATYTYIQFTNGLFLEGVTNPNDITNGMRDMTNVYGPLTNQYGRNGL